METIKIIYQITMLVLVMTASLFLGIWTLLITPTPEFNFIGIIFFSVIFNLLSILSFILLLYILFEEEEEDEN